MIEVLHTYCKQKKENRENEENKEIYMFTCLYGTSVLKVELGEYN